MRRFVSITIAVLTVGGFLFARSGEQSPSASSSPSASATRQQQQQQPDTKIIDLKSDISGPVAPGDSVIFMVGNFAAQHNGAVITCDSAVRYSDKHVEFFGNVLINKNTTYIYGDRADYNGELNEARVFSDLIKVVDEDATLYTYQFVFNTKDNIGRFYDGGVMTNRDNRLEAVRGYYYADNKELIGVDQVEMRNEDYELKGDSVIYNMATDHAFFFERTNIWSKDGDYLYADRGSYDKADSLYIVTRNGYVLTEKQEMWSDSIDYYRAKEHVILRRDIQIDDTEHKVLAFGEYGEYWKEPGNALLTRRPSMISYDLSQGDSLFMRADSMFLYTLRIGEPIPGTVTADSLAAKAADSLAGVKTDSLSGAGRSGRSSTDSLRRTSGPDSLARPDVSGPAKPGAEAKSGASGGANAEIPADSLSATGGTPPSKGPSAKSAAVPDSPADSLDMDSQLDSLGNPIADSIPAKERLKEAARKEKEARKLEAAKAKKKLLDEIAAKRREKTNARLQAEAEREEIRLKALKVRMESKLKARQVRAARKGKTIAVDSAELRRIDSLLGQNAIEQDSLATLDSLGGMDSLARDSIAVDSLAMPADSLDSLSDSADSIFRFIRAYRKVKAYRSDFQVVCDSLTAISTDSTIHLYIEPVLWNEGNQVTSDVMDIFTKNQQIVRAECVGSPMMVSQLDTTHYNQIAGKAMTAFFRDNEIYRNDVNGNAQTIYYTQDGEPPEITGMMVVESGDASFYIEQKQVVTIVYRNDVTDQMYPMDKIPESQELYLKGFKWEGSRRPTQAEVFDRRIRPTERERVSTLRRPDFPIQMKIDEYRKRLIELRQWSDRNDKVDPATIEWMRDLGFEVGKPRESGPVL